jgi:cytochrome c oxidase cbb3-type subunit 1
MWRTYTENNTLAYSFVDTLVAMYPYYIARAFGGFLFFLGAVVGAYNIWMTARRGPVAESTSADLPIVGPSAQAAPGPAE